MTMTLPFLLMTLHLSHIGLTLGLTFIFLSSELFVPVNDSALREVVGRHFDFYSIPFEDSDVVDAELSAEVCQDDMTVGEFDPELRFGQNFDYLTFRFDDIGFGHKSCLVLLYLSAPYIRSAL